MKHQNELENLAKQVISRSGIQTDEHGSVVLVLMVVSIILTMVRIIQECHKDEDKTFYYNQIKKISKTRSWFTKLRIKRIIKRQLSKDEYSQYKNNMVEAILDVADELTEDQVSLLLEV